MIPTKQCSSQDTTSSESSVLVLGRFGTYLSRINVRNKELDKAEPSGKESGSQRINLVGSRHEPIEASEGYNFGKIVRFRSKDFVLKYNKTTAEASLDHLRAILNQIVDTIDLKLSKKLEENNVPPKILEFQVSDIQSEESFSSTTDFRFDNVYKMPLRPRKNILFKIESRFCLQCKFTEDDFFALHNLFLHSPRTGRLVSDVKQLLRLRNPPTLAEIKLLEKEFKRIIMLNQQDLTKLEETFTVLCGPTKKQLRKIEKRFKLARTLSVDDFFEIRSMIKRVRKFNGVNIADLQSFLQGSKFTPGRLLDLQNYLTISFSPSKKQLKSLNDLFKLPNFPSEEDFFDLRNKYKEPCKATEKPLIDFYLSLLPCEYSETQIHELRRLVQNEGGLLDFTNLDSSHNKNFLAVVRDYGKISDNRKKSFIKRFFTRSQKQQTNVTKSPQKPGNNRKKFLFW